MFSFKIKSFKKSERNILIGLLSILIILISVTFLTHRNSKRVIASALQVDRTQEIKYHIEQVLAEITDIETNARGYVITGDASYFKPNTGATADIFAHLSQIGILVEDDEVMADHLEKLSDLVDARVDLSKQVIYSRTNESSEKAMALVAQGDGKKIMGEIKTM